MSRPTSAPRIPKICRQSHKNRPDRAYVVLNGQRNYLDRWEDPLAHAEYDRLIAEWLSRGRSRPHPSPHDLIITELVVEFLQSVQAEQRYRQPQTLKPALRVLRRLYGHTLVGDFDLTRLEVVQQEMVRQRNPRTNKPWARRYVNANVQRVLRVFRWGKRRGLVPPEVWARIQDVEHLQKGRTEAPETEPVRPAPDEDVEAIKPFVSRQVWAMVQLQRLTGARPGEVVAMRLGDIDRTHEVWVYAPRDHKNAHRGKPRVIPLGPRCQSILAPFLCDRPGDGYLFSPCEAEAHRKATQRQSRRSKVQPSQRDRSKANPKRKPLDHYTTLSYARAIRRAIQKAYPHPEFGGIPSRALSPEQRKLRDRWKPPQHWHPNQLRHSFATRIRRDHGVETACVLLGHSKIETTQIYAETNLNTAIQIARKEG